MKLNWTGKRTLIAVVLVGGAALIYVQGAEERAQGPASNDTSECRVASTVNGLNVRSAPALDPTNVVGQLAEGQEAAAAREVRNGFRKLDDDRWVSVQYTQPLDGSNC